MGLATENDMTTIFVTYNTPPFLPRHVLRDLRALWAAEEAGVPYSIHWLNSGEGALKAPDYLAVHPFGIVPALTEGAFKLVESGAIVGYLLDKTGRCIPQPRTQERALYDQWCFTALNTMEPPVLQLFIASVIAKDMAWAKERAPQLRDLTAARLKVLDAHLANRPYLLGGEFSGADILMGQVLNFIVDVSLFDHVAHVKAYHARVTARPAYIRAAAVQAAGPETAAAAR
jgi:glutathione S-transferase